MEKATAAAEADRIRLNLVVSRQIKDRVERLQALSEATSITEVIRRALAIYEELLQIRQEGGQLVVEGDGERQILRFI